MSTVRVVVVVSADAEWAAVREIYPEAAYQPSPYGEWFCIDAGRRADPVPVVVFQGGWGKISAAASAQYAIDRWHPGLLLNLGTCGGFKGHIARGALVVARRTLVYDIVEQMLDPGEAIRHYSTDLDISWLQASLGEGEYRGILLSADRDILPEDIPRLRAQYNAVAADWESGAIAWVAARNGVDCLIARGITDLVDVHGGEAYAGRVGVFAENARAVMKCLNSYLETFITSWAER